MREALSWMLRADGTLWALNDTAADHEVALGPLLAGTAAPAGVREFRRVGVAIAIDSATNDRIRFDASAPAPPFQPAHSHAGALGFELDVGGVPCLVDGGCSGYDGDPWRPHLRSTAAHRAPSLNSATKLTKPPKTGCG